MSTSDSTSTTTPASPTSAAPRSDWRAERRRERNERRHARWEQLGEHHGWAGVPVGALILICLGLVFLAQNMGYALPERWWAMFLLIPAGGAFVYAIRCYREHATWTGQAMAALVSGGMFLLLWAAFFFGLDWGLFWPVILIAIGVGTLVRAYWPD